jgi:hypothetical protein
MKNVEKAIACLKALGGFKPSIGSFEDRLKIQKIIYLLELKGIKMGFSYSLYVRGPYSPDLTKEIYVKREDFENLRSDAKLSQKEETAVHELGDLFRMKSSLLEVAATYGYYVATEKQDPISAYRSVKRLKPFFTEAQVAVGISKAKEFLFPPTETQLEGMRKEMRLWEAAPDQRMDG